MRQGLARREAQAHKKEDKEEQNDPFALVLGAGAQIWGFRLSPAAAAAAAPSREPNQSAPASSPSWPQSSSSSNQPPPPPPPARPAAAAAAARPPLDPLDFGGEPGDKDEADDDLFGDFVGAASPTPAISTTTTAAGALPPSSSLSWAEWTPAASELNMTRQTASEEDNDEFGEFQRCESSGRADNRPTPLQTGDWHWSSPASSTIWSDHSPPLPTALFTPIYSVSSTISAPAAVHSKPPEPTSMIVFSDEETWDAEFQSAHGNDAHADDDDEWDDFRSAKAVTGEDVATSTGAHEQGGSVLPPSSASSRPLWEDDAFWQPEAITSSTSLAGIEVTVADVKLKSGEELWRTGGPTDTTTVAATATTLPAEGSEEDVGALGAGLSTAPVPADDEFWRGDYRADSTIVASGSKVVVVAAEQQPQQQEFVAVDLSTMPEDSLHSHDKGHAGLSSTTTAILVEHRDDGAIGATAGLGTTTLDPVDDDFWRVDYQAESIHAPTGGSQDVFEEEEEQQQQQQQQQFVAVDLDTAPKDSLQPYDEGRVGVSSKAAPAFIDDDDFWTSAEARVNGENLHTDGYCEDVVAVAIPELASAFNEEDFGPPKGADVLVDNNANGLWRGETQAEPPTQSVSTLPAHVGLGLGTKEEALGEDDAGQSQADPPRMQSMSLLPTHIGSGLRTEGDTLGDDDGETGANLMVEVNLGMGASSVLVDEASAADDAGQAGAEALFDVDLGMEAASSGDALSCSTGRFAAADDRDGAQSTAAVAANSLDIIAKEVHDKSPKPTLSVAEDGEERKTAQDSSLMHEPEDKQQAVSTITSEDDAFAQNCDSRAGAPSPMETESVMPAEGSMQRTAGVQGVALAVEQPVESASAGTPSQPMALGADWDDFGDASMAVPDAEAANSASDVTSSHVHMVDTEDSVESETAGTIEDPPIITSARDGELLTAQAEVATLSSELSLTVVDSTSAIESEGLQVQSDVEIDDIQVASAQATACIDSAATADVADNVADDGWGDFGDFSSSSAAVLESSALAANSVARQPDDGIKNGEEAVGAGTMATADDDNWDDFGDFSSSAVSTSAAAADSANTAPIPHTAPDADVTDNDAATAQGLMELEGQALRAAVRQMLASALHRSIPATPPPQPTHDATPFSALVQQCAYQIHNPDSASAIPTLSSLPPEERFKSTAAYSALLSALQLKPEQPPISEPTQELSMSQSFREAPKLEDVEVPSAEGDDEEEVLLVKNIDTGEYMRIPLGPKKSPSGGIARTRSDASSITTPGSAAPQVHDDWLGMGATPTTQQPATASTPAGNGLAHSTHINLLDF